MPEFWLHYIGKHIYPIDRFEREARRLGVQRAVPFYMIKRFRWGDRILLAQHVDGSAEVFGYFTVEAIVNSLPENAKKLLAEKLKIISISSGPKYERRFCGGYTIGSTLVIADSIEQFFEKAKKACKEAGVDPNKVKWFLRGKYKRLRNSILLKPAKFTRSYIKVKIEGLHLDSEVLERGALIWIYNYRKRKYFKKGEEVILETTKPLDEYFRSLAKGR